MFSNININKNVIKESGYFGAIARSHAMKFKIDDGVLKDIIWEDGDGTTLTIPDGVEVIDTQFRITGRVDTVFCRTAS